MTNEKQNLKDEFKEMSRLRKLLFVGIPILVGILAFVFSSIVKHWM